MNYYSEFVNAVERTENWGFDPGEITLDKSVSYLDRNSHFELLELFERNHNNPFDESLMDCTHVSIRMLDSVRDHFSTDAFLTTGDLSSDGESYYNCSVDYLKIVARGKEFNPKLNIHMWITLSSGEIIDFTFFRSMAKAFSRYAPMKSLIVITPFLEDLQLVYSPMIIGSDFYKKTGNLIM
ncbi:hypothetical protein [Fluviicola sp.]|uniref:hypothetical protein n=1 Tax=Fluviicola sp. TaxID=1917219 RepID=UPI003D2C7054